MRFSGWNRNEKGIVLVTTLLILSLLLAAGSGVVQSIRTDLRTTSNLKRRAKAFYIAQAGLEHGWQELTDGDGLNDFNFVFDVKGTRTLFHDMSFSAGSYTVTARPLPGSDPKRILITSAGCLPAGHPCPQGHSHSVLEGQLVGSSLYSQALLAKQTITLSGAATTDSFDSRIAPYEPISAGGFGHLVSNGDIDLSGAKTEIRGDARAGGEVITKGAKVMGVKANGARQLKIPVLHFPCHSSFSDGAGISGGHYNSVTGELKALGSNPVTVAKGTYCLNSIDLSEGGPLTISEPVTIYLRSKANFLGGGIRNLSLVAGNLKVISAYQSNDFGITLSGGNGTYLVVYAPDTGVRFIGGKDFFGSIIASRIEDKGGTRIHLDLALEEDPSVLARRVAWRELF